MSNKTEAQYDAIVIEAAEIFLSKQEDYSPSWLIYRLSSLIDKIWIKAKRIREIEEMTVTQLVQDSVRSEFLGIVNYSIMSLFDLDDSSSKRKLGEVPSCWINKDQSKETYKSYVDKARALMLKKNHDYGEAWRDLEVSSITDEILVKLRRIKAILKSKRQLEEADGVDAQLLDCLNYSVFAIITLDENEKTSNALAATNPGIIRESKTKESVQPLRKDWSSYLNSNGKSD